MNHGISEAGGTPYFNVDVRIVGTDGKDLPRGEILLPGALEALDRTVAFVKR